MFEGFTDWKKGWVEWVAEGGNTEGLLNAAYRNRIFLWNVRCADITVRACCHARNYRKLRKSAQQCGMRMHLTDKHGLPFYLFRYRARKGLLVGAFLFVFILQQLSCRVWSLQIEGNIQTETAAVLQTLEALGLRQGQPFPKDGTEKLQRKALHALPQFSFLSFQLSGSCVRVTVREREEIPPVAVSQPSNLKAEREGIVRKITTTAGTAYVKEGDAVKAGDLLIGGVREEAYGTHLLQATGEVWAETVREFQYTVALREEITVPNGETVYLPQIRLFGWTVPLHQSGIWSQYSSVTKTERKWKLLGKEMPIGVICYRLDRPVTQTVERTEQQARQQVQQQWAQQCAALQRQQITVLSADKQETFNQQEYRLFIRCICLENIAVCEKLLRIPTQN